MVARHARLEIDEDRFAPYKVVGELGARPLPVYIARHATPGGAAAPVVVAERFIGAGDDSGADFRREARRISTLANQHILRVREVVVRGPDVVVFGDFIEGEKLASLWRLEGDAPAAASGARTKPGERLALEITLRWLLDILTGVSALHALRDARQQPMKLMHGEISPATILIGLDGVGRILHVVARRAPDVRAEAASLDYLAPEIHANASRDGRADVFSVGVLLWEALAGTPLSAKQGGPAGLNVRSEPVAAPPVPESAPWSKGLLPVVAKALAYAPEDRWQTAAAMAAEIRKAAGLKLAPASAATAFAKNRFGERVKARRARLESLGASVPTLLAAPIATPPPIPAALLGSIASAGNDATAATHPAVPDPVSEAPAAVAAAPVAIPESAPAIGFDGPRPSGLPLQAPIEPPLVAAPFGFAGEPTSDGSAEAEIPDVFEEPFAFEDFEEPRPAVQAPPVEVFSAPLAPIATEEPVRSKVRRRHLVMAGGAAGVALASLLGFRALHRGAESGAQADAPVAIAPAASQVNPAALATASAVPPPPQEAPTPPPSSSAVMPAQPAHPHEAAPRTKPGTKGKPAGAAPPHTKATPARGTNHPKG